MYEYSVELDRVVDGDTIDAYINLGFGIKLFRRIRLIGIDAPETRTKNSEEKHKGIAVKEWLINKLTDCKIIVITEKDTTGKYGRVLGTIYADDININQLMIDNGLVESYEKF